MNSQLFDARYGTHYTQLLAQEGFKGLMLSAQAIFDQKEAVFSTLLQPAIDKLPPQPTNLKSRDISQFFDPREFEKAGNMLLMMYHSLQQELKTNPGIMETEYPAMIAACNTQFTTWHSCYNDKYDRILELYQALLLSESLKK